VEAFLGFSFFDHASTDDQALAPIEVRLEEMNSPQFVEEHISRPLGQAYPWVTARLSWERMI
jgi:hypothetical protein